MSSELLAFRVVIRDIDCIVFAETNPKARWQAVKGYWESGYGRKGTWPCPKAVRVPRLDSNPLRQKKQKCWVPEYVESVQP